MLSFLDFIKNPPTIKILIEELIRACDVYVARKITDDELRYLIQGWANTDGNKLFSDTDSFNPTVVQRVGKKRLNLINRMLVGFQPRLRKLQ